MTARKLGIQRVVVNREEFKQSRTGERAHCRGVRRSPKRRPRWVSKSPHQSLASQLGQGGTIPVPRIIVGPPVSSSSVRLSILSRISERDIAVRELEHHKEFVNTL